MLFRSTARIRYANNAPATLRVLYVYLLQNLHKEGSPRSSTEEITGGVTLTSVFADSIEMSEGDLADGPGYEIDGTLMTLRPDGPLEEGDVVVTDWDISASRSAFRGMPRGP